MSEVFVSYSSADQATAFRLVHALEKRGLTCWIAAREIPLGDSYQRRIPAAIAGCTVFVVLHSAQAAANPDEIGKEMSIARRLKKPFIPLRLDETKPGDVFLYEIATTQYLDMFPDFDAAVDTLTRRLAKLFSQEKEIEQRTRTLSRWRTTRIWALRTALVAMSCLAAAFAWKGAPLLHAMQGTRSETIDMEAIVPQDTAPQQVTLSRQNNATEEQQPPQPIGPEPRARDFVTRYFAMIAAPAVTWLPFLDAALANPVRFFGKSVPKAKLLDIQRAYAARWPVRSFQLRANSVTVDCNSDTARCTVTGIDDYSVRSDARGASAAGAERFTLELSMANGQPMRLTAISGVPIERHNLALGTTSQQ